MSEVEVSLSLSVSASASSACFATFFVIDPGLSLLELPLNPLIVGFLTSGSGAFFLSYVFGFPLYPGLPVSSDDSYF